MQSSGVDNPYYIGECRACGQGYRAPSVDIVPVFCSQRNGSPKTRIHTEVCALFFHLFLLSSSTPMLLDSRVEDPGCLPVSIRSYSLPQSCTSALVLFSIHLCLVNLFPFLFVVRGCLECSRVVQRLMHSLHSASLASAPALPS